ncbi:hypothetical protein V8F20_011060 [Naviculisporaceae sp. PSN 640]
MALADSAAPDEMAPTAAAAAAEAAQAAAYHFNVVIWTLYAIGVCVTGLRTYSRIKMVGGRRLQPDDYLVWLAVVFYTLQTVLGYEIGNLAHGLANNGMTEEQRAALSPTDPEYEMRIIGSKIQVAGWTIYSTLVTVLKLAMAVFFLRLTSGLGHLYRLRVYIGFALIVAGYLASIIAIFASCQPLSKNWQIYPDPGPSCYPATAPATVWSSFASNVISDMYLILIPIPLLWSSRLRFLEKLLSTIVLGAGVFVLVCATVKTVFIVTDDINGAELAGAWGTREAFVAVVVTNLPMVFPLLKAWLRPCLGSWLTSRTRSGGGGKTPQGGAGGTGAGGFQQLVARTIGGGEPMSRGTRRDRERERNRTGTRTKSTAAGKGSTRKSGAGKILDRRDSNGIGKGNNVMTDVSFGDSEERIMGLQMGMGMGIEHEIKDGEDLEMGIYVGMGTNMGNSVKAEAVAVEVEDRGNQSSEKGTMSSGHHHGEDKSGGGGGIAVSREFKLHEDTASVHHHHHPARVHEPW